MNFDATMRSIQSAVTDAGGDWIGIQDAFPSDLLAIPKIVFRHPRTKKAVLLPFNPATCNYDELKMDVLKLIGDDHPETESYVSVSAAKLKTLARKLQDILNELEVLLERKKK
jgi:hypothetical protein